MMYRQLIMTICWLLPFALYGQLEPSYLDKDFGQGKGYVNQGLGNSPGAICEDTVREQLFVTGSVAINGEDHMVVRCYDMTGSLKLDWGDQGEVIFDFGAPSYGTAIALQSAGFSPSIFVAGYTGDRNEEWALAKLTIDGKRDSLFDLDGQRTLSLGPSSIARDVEPLASGGFLVSGETGFNLAVAKFLFTGTLDGFFGVQGVLTIDITSLDTQGKIEGDGTGTGLFSDGNFLLASIGQGGGLDKTAYLTRFDQYGTIDSNFGVNGHLALTSLTGEVFPLIDMVFDQGKVGVAGNYVDTALHQGIIYWQVDTSNWQVQGPQTFQFGVNHHIAGLSYESNGNLQIGFKAEIDGRDDLGVYQVFPNNVVDRGFGDDGVKFAGFGDIFIDGIFNQAVGYTSQTDGKTLFVATLDDNGDEEGIIARVGDKTVRYVPPTSEDTLITFSLNHGQRNARLAFPIDLNRDGIKDLISHDDYVICTTTHLYNLDGSGRAFFDPRWEETITLPYPINEIDTLDADGDGAWDLYAACSGALIVVLHDNDSMVVIQSGNFIESVTGDINGDNRTDIVALDATADTVWQFTSLGNGRFQSKVLLPNSEGVSILELVDVDQDQDLDLLVGGDATIPGGSNIWANDGQGNLSISTDLTPSTTSDFEIADINADGIPELLYYETFGPSPDLWALSLSSPLGAPIKLVENVTGPGWFADVDGLPGMEALLFNKVDRTLYLAQNLDLSATNPIDSIGYFPHANLDFSQGVRPDEMDFFLSNYNNNGSQMQLYHVEWEGDPFNPHTIRLHAVMAYHPDNLTDLDLMDMDADGDLDIIVVDPLSPNNDRTGSRFLLAENIAASGWVFKPYTYNPALNGLEIVAPFDMNGDGRYEISGKIGTKGIFMENVFSGGDQDFEDLFVQINASSTGKPSDLVIGDFLDDGTIDMMEWQADAQQLIYYDDILWRTGVVNAGQPITLPLSTPQSFSAYNNTAMLGGTADNHLYVVDIPTFSGLMTLNYFPRGSHPVHTQVVDLNQDQQVDWLIITTDSSQAAPIPYKLTAALQDGQGGYTNYELLQFTADFTAMSHVYDPQWGHIIFLATELPNRAPRVHVIQYTDSTLSTPASFWIPIPEATKITNLKAGDLNLDGIPDFVCLDPASGNVWVSLLSGLPNQGVTTSLDPNHLIPSDISLYPNPASDQVHIMSKNQRLQQVVLLDMQGKVVYSQKEVGRQLELSLSQLSPGSYIVQIMTENGKIEARKLLVSP